TPKGLVKILDFGLARFVSESRSVAPASGRKSSASSLTQTGTFMGTLDYIAPEQAEDAHTADIRADIYSLGCTLYTLLTGRVPFARTPMPSEAVAYVERRGQPIQKLRGDFSP